MSERDSFGAFLVGFVVGGLTGAVVALLFAPQTGEETRTLIKDKSIELYDKAGETIEMTYSQAEKAANEAVKQAEGFLSQAKLRAEEVQKQGQVMLEEQKAKIESKVKKVAKIDEEPLA